ncbi:plant virulence effector HPE1-like domain-containing protein [Rhizobium terrae]|uniref:plant virulence effector HPE1-like domain-containing protein n=1 Tax=Rhizobium terrae TaxID=2171756 RepID=UPI000E3D5427|nr:plant virulence effector HPE1-like domain-containing protein [Rhizobium terrae]
MRLVLTTALVFVSGAAYASSITTLDGPQNPGRSIVEKSCAHCAAAPVRTEEPSYKVPDLIPGTQKTELIDINGEKKLVRTEAWLGGSPVIYVSKVPAWMAQDSAIAEVRPTTNGSIETMIASAKASPDGVDTGATTGAVKISAEAEARIAAASVAPKQLDLDAFQLRTNAITH